ncbi:DUF5004 domain-containing protein [Niabella beijingensis]|uniref:DUF5004 domain-containing protein n=1 Tax=Niabella beijingensis TaxID=2872700 RepID=UPI001CC08BC0|nr:DUF5004 domain-containing protein [Niabella beijingensis]MBZ4191363.1 DUF5004 domain-containing protein [Niabella beijingensis]
MRSAKSLFFKMSLILVFFFINSCKKEQTAIYPEAGKNVVGTWKIASVVRNGVDITEHFDFTPFSIRFNEDGTYTMENQVPFVVFKNGTWSLDDVAHPLHISFVQNGSSETFTNEFDYPVVNGVRRIILKGAPGCVTNTYQYSLEAVQ